MQLEIRYFGMLAEHTDCAHETIPDFAGTAGELLYHLEQLHPGLSSFTFQIAQAHDIISKDDMITQPNISLLPPFAGG